jgi:hypothetical protein
MISSSTASEQGCMRVLLKFNINIVTVLCRFRFTGVSIIWFRYGTSCGLVSPVWRYYVDVSLLGAPQITGFGGVIRDYAELLSKKLWCCLTCKCVICKDSRCVAWVWFMLGKRIKEYSLFFRFLASCYVH